MNKLTFCELSILWRDTCLKRRNVEVRTKEEYFDILKNRVFPVIGDMDIQVIDGFVLDSLVDKLLEKGYTVKTVKNTFIVVKEVIKYAYRKGLIAEDPLTKMDDLPREIRDGSLHYFTPQECKIFLNILDEESLEARTILTIMIFSGCRRGELCAIRWSDIDFPSRTISIQRAASYTHSGLVIKRPKTVAGIRTISLPDCCFELLAELRQEADSFSDGYVFKDWSLHCKGAALKQNNLTDVPFLPPHRVSDRFRSILKRYNRACEKAGLETLPQIRLHDLRHTAATLLIASNVDVETVARRLGHANPSVTLNIYAHPTLDADYKASKVLEQILM